MQPLGLFPTVQQQALPFSRCAGGMPNRLQVPSMPSSQKSTTLKHTFPEVTRHAAATIMFYSAATGAAISWSPRGCLPGHLNILKLCINKRCQAVLSGMLKLHPCSRLRQVLQRRLTARSAEMLRYANDGRRQSKLCFMYRAICAGCVKGLRRSSGVCARPWCGARLTGQRRSADSHVLNRKP